MKRHNEVLKPLRAKIMKTYLKLCGLWRCVPVVLAAWVFLGLSAGPGRAHTLQVEPVVVEVRPQETFLTVEIGGNGEDIIQAVKVRDSERVGNDFVPAVEQRLRDYVDKKLILKQGGQTLRGEIVNLEYWRPDDFDYTKSKFSMILRYNRDVKVAAKPFLVTTHLFDYLPNSQTILSIGGVQKTLNPGQSVEFDPSAVTTNLFNNIKDFTLMGIEHIFTGPDHMLFIVVLLLVSTSFVSLAKTLTGFTIAHSITLIISALSIVVLPNRLVDILIALSIIYVGLENIFWKNSQRHRFWIAAVFGLIHGFGFSYTLREIGLPEQGLVWCLLSFNIGVEIAQLIICAVTFPLLLKLRKKFEHEAQYGGRTWPQAMHAMSWCVVAAGSYWLLQRAFEA